MAATFDNQDFSTENKEATFYNLYFSTKYKAAIFTIQTFSSLVVSRAFPDSADAADSEKPCKTSWDS